MKRWKLQAARAAFLVLAAAGVSACKGTETMKAYEVTREPFGEVKGRKVELFTLRNDHGMTVKITNYGGIVTELHVPDRDGRDGDVVLGFDSLDGYLKGHPYFGALVGRVANRIAGARFTLDGKEYVLAANNGTSHLHGGTEGFDKKVWEAEPLQTADGPALRLSYRSPDGEEGYPGNLDVTVTYALTEENGLEIDIRAVTDAPTPVNLTNHSYFNLAGHGAGEILGHVLTLEADAYTPTDADLVPTGEIRPVEGTPYDFRTPKPIGKDIAGLPPDPAHDNPGGYDVNYVLRGRAGTLRLAARVFEPGTGREMEVYTTQPGIQLYTGNFLDGTLTGKDGAVYRFRNGFCLETQHFPDSVHHPEWPTVILRPGETYHEVTVYKFSTR